MWQHARTRQTLLCKERTHKVNNKTKASRHFRLEIRPNEGDAVSNFSTSIHYTQMILSERIQRCDTLLSDHSSSHQKSGLRRWWPQQRTITISIEIQCRSVHNLAYCLMTRWRCESKLIRLDGWVVFLCCIDCGGLPSTTSDTSFANLFLLFLVYCWWKSDLNLVQNQFQLLEIEREKFF